MYGAKEFKLSYFSKCVITLENKMCLYTTDDTHSSAIWGGEMIGYHLLNKAMLEGKYTPNSPEFAEVLDEYKDMSIKITDIKEIKLYPDLEISIKTAPIDLCEFQFAFEWLDLKMGKYTKAMMCPMVFRMDTKIVASPQGP